MLRPERVQPLMLLAVTALATMAGLRSVPGMAAHIVLKSGMHFEGRPGKISGLMQNPNYTGDRGEGVGARLIVFVNDELRRTYFPKYQVQEITESEPTRLEHIMIPQRVANSGPRVSAVGPIVRLTPWDLFGRRIFSMQMQGRGTIDVVQGVTEITPRWTKVEGLVGHRSVVWDMRIATSSIPRETLSNVLNRYINADSADDRLRVVRLYTQSGRYQEARTELDAIIAQFPELHDLTKQSQALRQMNAEKLVAEIKLRRDAGQHRRARFILSNFPDEKVAGETLIEVRQILKNYQEEERKGGQVQALLDEHLAAVDDVDLRNRLQPMVDQIKQQLNVHNLDRMADYLRLAEDKELTDQQKMALAISGCVLGSGAGLENLAVAISLYEVRQWVRQYLRAERSNEREAILERIQAQEGGAPRYVASIIHRMRPPLDPPAQEDNDLAGLFRLKVPGLTGHADTEYLVQLPPEYDPDRRYPTIVTLHSAVTTPELQIDWWAGPSVQEKSERMGQASRQGYIVIAPHWTTEHQPRYEYTAREHAAVLYALRDACRRFSIDTDRVYLSGHSMGGDAAWDIGLAHPDLWAAVIPIVAVADKYVARYWENGRNVPMYFVIGELDGNKLTRNVRDLDRYLTKTGFDTIVVEYLGRGHEHFQDEIHRLFQWMGLQRREFPPPKSRCFSMRPWDNFFWWIELDEMPTRSMVVPVHWPPESGVRPVLTKAEVRQRNRLMVTTGAGQITVWLSPDMVNFDDRITITVNGRAHRNPEGATPDTAVLLEDVRTRGDRQHPFWAKVKLRNARRR